MGEDIYWINDGILSNSYFESYNKNSIYAGNDLIVENTTQNTFHSLTELKNLIDKSTNEITLENDYNFVYGDDKRGIQINKDLKIEGNNKIIDGMGISPIFNVSKGCSLSITNLIFNKSKCAIYNEGRINISNTLFNNYLNGSSIYSQNEIYLTNCSFSLNNNPSYFTDIFANGTGIINNCNFTKHYYNENYYHGLPLSCLNINGNISLINSSFMKNSGGLIKSKDNSIINNCKFLDNLAVDNNLIVLDDRSDIMDSLFMNNSLYQINIVQDTSTISVLKNNHIINCTFIKSSSDNHGCAISIKNSLESIYKNLWDDVLIKNCSFINCTSRCGAISVNCLEKYIFNESAYKYYFSNLTIENCSFINNTAYENGGAIYIPKNNAGYYSICSVFNSKFFNNKADGLGIDIYNEGNISLSKNEMIYDIATIYNANYKKGSIITSPTILVILDNSTINVYGDKPIIIYSKLMDDNGNLIEDDRISLNIGSLNETFPFNKKTDLFEYTLNNVNQSLLISGSYNGATDLKVKTGYLSFTKNSAGGNIAFINNNDSVDIILRDNDENFISNAKLDITNNGVESTLTTDANGKATIKVNGNTALIAIYKDMNNATISGYFTIIEKNNTMIKYINATTNKTDTKIIYSNMTTTSVASVDGRIGKYFNVKLVNNNGLPLLGKKVQIGFNGKIYNRTTDEKGEAKLQINLVSAGRYTFAICFLGDENNTGSFEVALITVQKQTPKLIATTKSFKVSAKTKTVTATFKTSIGNTVKGKKITFSVNGKTYQATTNSKGVASIKISLNKKGTYSCIAKFAGDEIFKPTSKKFYVKID